MRVAEIVETAGIIIQNLSNRKISITNKAKQTVFAYIQDKRIDWMHACGTKGRCTTCKFEVIEGANNITEKNEVELKYQKLGQLKQNERLACQCTPLGNIVIRVPESSKMPHMNYSD